MEKLSVIVSLLFASVAVSRGQECSVDRLPPFGDARNLENSGRPDRDRFQAIVPAYTFQCSGRVTEWRACVQRGGDRYYIQFQVWRPITGTTDGCYELVDYNTPEDTTETMETEEDRSSRSRTDARGELLSPESGRGNPLDHCVVLPVRPERQIEFQSGDVVGYYVDRDGDDRDDDNTGIQWIEDTDVVIYYRDQIPRDGIQSYYAINGPNPTECGFPMSGDSNSYSLTVSTDAAPIISLSIAINAATTLLPPSPPAGPLITGLVLTSAQTLPLTLSPTSPPPVILTTSQISTLLSSSLPATSYMSSSPTVLTSSPCIHTCITGSSSTQAPLLSSTTPLPSGSVTIIVATDTSSLTPSPSASTHPFTPPPASTASTGSDDRTTIIVAVIFVTVILVLVIAVTGGIIAMLVNRSRNDKVAITTLDNPFYQDATILPLKPVGTSEANHLQSLSSVPYYDYCSVPATVGGAQTEEGVYATIANGDDDYSSIGVDYTTIYNDPTSPSFVSEVYSTGSVFDSAGTCVPTLGERTRYEQAESTPDGVSPPYNTLQFFERDTVFWSPASTTSGLYEQLCTRRYREISRKQIRILEQIGSGQFGTVAKGVWVYQNETMQVAVKTLTKTASEVDRVKFLQEAAIMGQFYHPNIIRLHGVVTVGQPVMIVLDFMPKGDMKSYLDNLIIRNEDQIRLPNLFLKFGREIAAGMAYLAKKSFVHRDLAARNILLDQRMSCKVGDFGMARDLMDDTYYKSKGGQIPVRWTAPEGLLYKKYSTASDVWSYAMVLYEIWSVGKKPFQSLSNRDVIGRLQSPQCLAPPPGCPRQVYSLMVDCWNPEPQLRPTFDAVFRTLRSPEELLLHWTEEDVAAERHLLRASHTTHSFSDLQNKYTTL